MRKCIESLMKLDVLVLMPLVLGLLITSVGFLFGRICSPWTLRVIFALELLGVVSYSWRLGVKLFGVLLGLSLLTCLTFSYTGTDTINYHFPMQDLLINGWNPVFDSTLEKFARVSGGIGLSAPHALFLPKVHSLCGALVALSLNLFVGDAFLNYAVLFALMIASYRFAQKAWSLSIQWNLLFAITCSLSTKLISIFDGHVDFLVYASLSLVVFSAYLWWKDYLMRDLVMLVIAAVICSLCKTTGLVNVVLIFACLTALVRKRSDWYCAILVALVLILIIGANPLLTNWIQYGSPLYPSMSFDPNTPVIDITDDFTSNADGARMGYFARVTYAWFSPVLAKKACALWYGIPNFNPVFYVSSGVGGYGAFFTMLLWLSAIALIFSKKNFVTLLTVLIFISANLAPLKYIGYSRYFPQIRLIPMLAFFNLLAYPCFDSWGKAWIYVRKWSAYALILILTLFTVLPIIRSIAGQLRFVVNETLRQSELSAMKKISSDWSVCVEDSRFYYAFKSRAAIAGVQLHIDEDYPRAYLDARRFLISSKRCDTLINNLETSYPFCNSVKDLIKYDWIGAAKSLTALRINQRGKGDE